MRSDLVTGFKYAGQKAVCFHALNLRSALKELPWRMGGIFCSCRRGDRHSLVRGGRAQNSFATRESGRGRDARSSAIWRRLKMRAPKPPRPCFRFREKVVQRSCARITRFTALMASTLDAFVSKAGATTNVSGANGLCKKLDGSMVVTRQPFFRLFQDFCPGS